MNGQVFIDSIFRNDSQTLKTTYIQLTKTSITKLALGKAGDVKNKLTKNEQPLDSYERFLAEETANITMAKEELIFAILREYALYYQLSMNGIGTRRGMDDFAEELLGHLTASYQTMQSSITKRMFRRPIPELHSYQDCVLHYFEKVYEQVDKQLKSGSEADRREIEKRFTQFVEQMPEEKQKQLMDELNLADLSSNSISKVLATNGSVVLFSSIVQVMGFSFYTGATSLLASTTGLLGLTLPFGVYSGMTSAIAVLANPITLLGVLGLSAFYMVKQNNKVKEMIMFASSMQLALSADYSGKPADIHTVHEQWRTVRERYKSKWMKLQQMNTRESELTDQVQQKQTQITTAIQTLKTLETKLETNRQRLIETLKRSERMDLSSYPALENSAYELKRIKRLIETKAHHPKQIIDSMKSLKKAEDRLYKDLADNILRLELSISPELTASSRLIHQEMQHLRHKQATYNEELRQLQDDHQAVRSAIKKKQKQLTELSDGYPGISAGLRESNDGRDDR